MKNVQAFTLIELLVVVLIIGILAGVALPQYNKAVEKSRSAQALTLLKSTYDAATAYNLANGTHATSIDELSIDIPWTGTAKWTSSVDGDAKSNGEWSLQLYNSTGGQEPGVSVGHISGKYTGCGFMIYLSTAQHSLPKEVPLCVERISGGYSFSGTAGSYCTHIMKGSLIGASSLLRWYTMP